MPFGSVLFNIFNVVCLQNVNVAVIEIYPALLLEEEKVTRVIQVVFCKKDKTVIVWHVLINFNKLYGASFLYQLGEWQFYYQTDSGQSQILCAF